MASFEITKAVEYCLSVRDKAASARAYSMLLDAVGNNHAGTYGPDALQLISSLLPVLEAGSPWAQHAALEAMIDLGGSFEAEPAFLVFEGLSLQGSVRKRIAELEAQVASIASNQSIAKASARTLLDLIHEVPA